MENWFLDRNDLKIGFRMDMYGLQFTCRQFKFSNVRAKHTGRLGVIVGEMAGLIKSGRCQWAQFRFDRRRGVRPSTVSKFASRSWFNFKNDVEPILSLIRSILIKTRVYLGLCFLVVG